MPLIPNRFKRRIKANGGSICCRCPFKPVIAFDPNLDRKAPPVFFGGLSQCFAQFCVPLPGWWRPLRDQAPTCFDGRVVDHHLGQLNRFGVNEPLIIRCIEADICAANTSDIEKPHWDTFHYAHDWALPNSVFASWIVMPKRHLPKASSRAVGKFEKLRSVNKCRLGGGKSLNFIHAIKSMGYPRQEDNFPPARVWQDRLVRVVVPNVLRSFS